MPEDPRDKRDYTPDNTSPGPDPRRKNRVKLVADYEFPRIETEDTASIPPQKRREQQGEVL